VETTNTARHSRWVKISHAIVTLSFFVLLFSGFEITMVHPRFYWGEVGNDLTPALFELPISRNYKHNGFTKPVAFFPEKDSPVSASRTFNIFNQNGWGRSLHFLAGWFLFAAGFVYFIWALLSSHIRGNLLLKRKEWQLKLWREDVVKHLRFKIPSTTGGPHYGLLQKSTYLIVILILFPLIILTGMSMSPALTATYPFLLKFWGAQSARTIHFICSTLLLLFLLVHLAMIIVSGFKKNIKAITVG
jgi:thiosulfate reductase cytochrome b subunit